MPAIWRSPPTSWGLDELNKALEAGVDELAHMLMSNRAIPDETIEEMVRQEVTVVPTLSVGRGRSCKAPSTTSDASGRPGAGSCTAPTSATPVHNRA